MTKHIEISPENLHKKIRNKEVILGGNKLLKIYGTLYCRSGKRLKKINRVFFVSEAEAIENGYRPCGNCLKEKYKSWKNK
jgi:methylphosphotriester-DNA--protein-cysteine methyltransferase